MIGRWKAEMRQVAAKLIVVLVAASCSSAVPGDVPGYDRVFYLGSTHTSEDVARALFETAIALQHEVGERPQWSGIEIFEDVAADATPFVDPRTGAIHIRPGYDLSDGGLSHELVHWHFRATGRGMDPDVAVDRDGRCTRRDRRTGICSHADSRGVWTVPHDLAIERAQDSLARCGL